MKNMLWSVADYNLDLIWSVIDYNSYIIWPVINYKSYIIWSVIDCNLECMAQQNSVLQGQVPRLYATYIICLGQ